MTVEIASTEAQRERGLMFRTWLGDNAGMLFIFEKPEVLSFWMKNTLIPLDVVFFDAKGKFVSVAAMTPCVSDPCGGYASAAPAGFALEVNPGFTEYNKIGEGWTLKQ